MAQMVVSIMILVAIAGSMVMTVHSWRTTNDHLRYHADKLRRHDDALLRVTDRLEELERNAGQ